ncbi:MAG: SpoIIE family protein phosphatase [Planctomycetota bacterium]
MPDPHSPPSHAPSDPPKPAPLRRLVAVSGPTPVDIPLRSGKTVSLGRQAGCDVRLVDAAVSRRHAELRPDAQGPGWRLEDLGSRHGTLLNGEPAPPGAALPLEPGDRVEVRPWVFVVEGASDPVDMVTHVVAPSEDAYDVGPRLTPLEARSAPDLSGRRLEALLSCAEKLEAASDLRSLADAVAEAAVQASGYPNAAVLRPADADGRVEVLAARGAIAQGDPLDAGRAISRSALRAAEAGKAVSLGPDAPDSEMHSMVRLGIEDLVCVPLTPGGSIAGYLYLDRRSDEPSGAGSSATDSPGKAFAIGLAKVASLAWSGLQRLTMQRRLDRLHAEMEAAALAQRWILPRASGRFAGASYDARSLAGQRLAGDLFLIRPLNQGRLAAAIGDVSGKGPAAAMLMTVTMGFLEAALAHDADPERVMRNLADYLATRSETGAFVTAWLGVLDPIERRVDYIDAGHGYAQRVSPEAEVQTLDEHGGAPLGVESADAYRAGACDWNPGDRLVLVSDGLVEQPALASQDRPRGEMFGRARLLDLLKDIPWSQEIETLFTTVSDHAGNARFEDDATALVVRWDDGADNA